MRGRKGRSMLRNRSVPPGPVIPFLYYEDVPRAIEWLNGAFGFSERLRTPAEPDGSIHLAQINVGEGSVMLRTMQTGDGSRPGQPPQSILVRIEDVDAHCKRARAFGARIAGEPRSAEFGERQYSAEDLAGNYWTFSQTIADIDPHDWGAEVKNLG
jgi:uncharacterized glyoxalase superfamily protein PhnB